MNTKAETLHRLIPRTENCCTESHVILSPPYFENDREYSIFKIFQNAHDLYVIDDCDDGITLKLSEVYTEIDELLPILECNPQDKRELCIIKVVKVMKTLPAIVSLERLERFPNEILFKDYDDLTSESLNLENPVTGH